MIGHKLDQVSFSIPIASPHLVLEADLYPFIYLVFLPTHFTCHDKATA